MPKEIKKQQLERILYENYSPPEGLGADEIDQAIIKILSLFPDRDAMVKRLEGEKRGRKMITGNWEHLNTTSLEREFNEAIDTAIKIIRGEDTDQTTSDFIKKHRKAFKDLADK